MIYDEEKERQILAFTHDDIKEFYKRHFGTRNRQEYGPAAFIPVEHFYRDERAAIHRVLLFLDQYGDAPIPDSTDATLRKHNLRLAEVIIQSLHKKRMSSFYVFPIGFAALANNIGLGLGSKYYEQFKGKPPIGVGQASLALLEQMPEFYCLHRSENIQEIIKFFHICVDTTINTPKLHVDRETDAWKLAKLLAAAEHQVRREEIFCVATDKLEGFWSADEQTKAKKSEEAAETAQQAAQERQQLDIKDNRENYLAEIEGLKKKLKQLVRVVKELKIKNKILGAQKKLIDALENGEEKVLTLAKKKLENEELKLKIFLTNSLPDEANEEISAQAEVVKPETEK